MGQDADQREGAAYLLCQDRGCGMFIAFWIELRSASYNSFASSLVVAAASKISESSVVLCKTMSNQEKLGVVVPSIASLPRIPSLTPSSPSDPTHSTVHDPALVRSRTPHLTLPGREYSEQTSKAALTRHRHGTGTAPA